VYIIGINSWYLTQAAYERILCEACSHEVKVVLFYSEPSAAVSHLVTLFSALFVIL